MVFNILTDGTYNAVQKILLLLAFVFSAMLAISLHEVSHGYVAHKCGDDTALEAGRLTLNPAVHFEPLGILMFLIVGFGWAKPVPVNPYNFKKLRKGMLLTAFAGVIANFILAFIGFWIMLGFGVWAQRALLGEVLYYFVFFMFNFALYTCLINTVLIAFNLLPIYPLDGFRVVQSLTPSGNGYVRFMHRYGSYILLGIVLLGFFFDRIGLPQLDVFGSYLTAMQKGVLKLYSMLLEAIG